MRENRIFSIKTLFSTAFGLGFLTSICACHSLDKVRPSLKGITSPSVSGDSCKNADWFEVGRIDGLNGIPANASTYVGRCEAKHMPIDRELYNAGWERGLVDYCTPDRAYDAGRAGEVYNGVCPKNLEAGFVKRYKVGIEIAQLEKKNAELEGQVDLKLSELAAIDGRPPSTEPRDRTTILDDALSRKPAEAPPEVAEKKSALQSEIRRLRDDLARNENTIRELERSSL